LRSPVRVVWIDRHETINSPGGLPALEENLLHNHAGNGFVLDAGGGKLAVWQIKHIGDVDVPYWDIKVDPSIIKNHGDLWNDRAEAMVASIFRMANPILNHNAKPRATLQRPPDVQRLRQHRRRPVTQ
jgi:hypothetical protein